MDEQRLTESAARIPAASRQAAQAYAASAESLAAAVSARMLAQGDIERMVGQHNLGLMMDVHRKQVRFLASTLADFDPALLVRTVVWAIRTHRSFGIKEFFWVAQQEAWREVLSRNLDPETRDQVMPLHDWLRERMPDLIRLSEGTP